MICYFSGTGNSQYAAKQIAETTGDELFSINHSLKSGMKEVLHSEKPYVFVAPVYAWRMPRIVENWIRENEFEGSRDAYFILTCGDSCGNAEQYAIKLCKEKGFRLRGLAPVVMPENYIAMYPVPSPQEAQAILEKSKEQIASLADCIKYDRPLPQTPVSFAGRLESGPVNPLFYAFCVKDKGFYYTDSCIGCGKCARLCPLNNITLQGNKPIWKGNCTHCMACICCCPTKAIEYNNKTKGRHRYFIMEEE